MQSDTFPPDVLIKVRDQVLREPLDAAGVVHLHLFAFRSLLPLVNSLRKQVSPDEEQRSRQFGSVDAGERFACGRGMLRWLLAAHLGRPPGQLVFHYSPEGRPALAGGEVDFNVSHNRDYLAIAVVRRGPVGVDVEGLEDVRDVLGIARRFFAAAEFAKLAALPEADRIRAFVRGWTQKEAYVKALGHGLSMPLSRFEVALLPGERCGLIASDLGDEEVARWCFWESESLPGAHVAVAVAGKHGGVRLWNWLDTVDG